VQTIGYEAGTATGHIQVGPLRDLEQLIDHQLGLGGPLPLVEFEITDTRFGIPAGAPVASHSGGEIELRANAFRIARVRLRSPSGATAEAAASVFAPSIPGLPLQKMKLRVKSSFLDVILRYDGGGTMNYSFSPDHMFTVHEMALFCSSLNLLAEGSTDIQLWDAVTEDRFFSTTADFPVRSLAREFSSVPLVLQLFRALLGSKESQFRVSTRQLNEDAIGIWTAALVAVTPSVNLSFVRVDGAPIPGAKWCFGYLDFEVAGWRMMAVIRRPIMATSYTDAEGVFQLGEPAILESYSFLSHAHDKGSILQSDYERHLKAAKESVLSMGDALAIGRGGGDVVLIDPDEEPISS
jgi:hypothetical protein